MTILSHHNKHSFLATAMKNTKFVVANINNISEKPQPFILHLVCEDMIFKDIFSICVFFLHFGCHRNQSK